MKYTELQKMSCWELKIIAGLLALVGLLRWTGVVGTPPESTMEILVGFALLGLAYLAMQSIYLKIKITRKGIKYRHQWWNRYKKIAWTDIRSIKPVSTTSAAQLSGWNVTFSTAQERHSLVGQSGINVYLKAGNSIFIGLDNTEIIEQIVRMDKERHA